MVRWLILTFLLFSSLLEATNAMAQIGYGAKAKGMGGVAAAFAQDAFAPITNPANAVRLCSRFDIGLGYIFQHGGARELDPAGQILAGTEFNSSRGLWFPEAALNWRINRCTALNLAAYVVGALDVDYHNPLPSLAGISRAPTSLTSYTVAVTPSWAVRISSVHAVGVGLNLLLSSLEISGIDRIGPLSVSPADVTGQGTDLAVGASIRVGWLLCIHKEAQLGISIRSKSWSQRFEMYRGFLAGGGRFDDPARLDLGITWWPLDKLLLSGDYILVGWQESKSFGHRGQGEGGPFGSSGGPGFGWTCQSIVRIGLHWCACPTLVVRLGFNVGINPIDATQAELNQLTLAQPESHVTIGFTRRCGWGELTGYYYYCFRRRVIGRDSDLFGGGNNFDTRNTQNGVGIAYGGTF